MDYCKLSDFEINKRVAEFIYQDCVELEVFQNTCKASTADVVSQGVFVTSFDFNNPSDAWPIIVENKISLISTICGKWVAEQYYEAGGSRMSPFRVEHEEPLRAAMIVYLMMKEGAV